MPIKLLDKLSNDYLELLNDNEDFNVIIKVGESSDTKIFQAHSAILRYRSLYFRNKLANVNKDENNIKTVTLNHISIQQFEVIIKYIYGGVILLEDYDASFIFKLMFFAHEFFLNELVNHLESYLIKEQSHWLRLHFADAYQKSFQNIQLRELQKWCNNIVAKYPNKVFDSEEFTSLQENALISLLKRDDLQMEEGKIWNYVIKWGIAQNQGLPSDSEDWTTENFQALKTTLQNCLPLIRYFQISGNDIVDNVQPYQPILEKNLWKDIMKRIVDPNRPISSIILPPRIILTPILPMRLTESFSTIINEEHAAEIATWVDEKTTTYPTRNNPYEFRLLIRGSRDGFTVDTFWNLCNKKENVVLIIKVKDTDEILGGYNPIGWEKPFAFKHIICNKSFIFSLKNGTIQNSIFSCAKPQCKTIWNNIILGPAFYYDLVSFNSNNKSYCQHTSYEKPIRNVPVDKHNQSFFSLEDYEIFQISKKHAE